MMNPRLIIIGVITVLVGGLIWIIIWYTQTVPLRIKIDKSSTITSGLVATTSKDNHQKSHKLPYNTRVKPGDYTITAWGNGSAVVTESVTVKKKSKNEFFLFFRETTGEDFIRLYNGELSDIPYIDLFPYETIDYLISASNNDTAITEITIHVKHRFFEPSDAAGYAEERRIVSDAAKKWLKDNGIPESIPIVVSDSL